MRSEKYRSKRNRKRRLSLLVPLVIVLALAVAAGGLWMSFSGSIRQSMSIEAGSPVPSAEDFIKNGAERIKALSTTEGIDSKVPGSYPLTFSWLFMKKTVYLEIKDTVAPKMELKDILASTGKRIEPQTFVTSLSDETDVTLSYAQEPDFSKEGSRQVTIVATDAGGNKTELSAQLSLFNDQTPPVIEGVKNRTVYLKDTISYKADVKVTDETDPSPKLTIDNSQVDLNALGSYPVTYTATDFCGNTSSVTITVTVEERPSGFENIEKLNQTADSLLAKILKPEMTEIERAYTIFRWIRVNVPWFGGRVEHNYVDQALKALQGNTGDCYTCTVGCKTLLERAGFEVKFMERTGQPGYHYWLMVKVGGNWYHMDPSPIYVNQFICFLGTDEQLKWFQTIRANYYEHDWSAFPKTPETSPAEVVIKNGKYALVIK